LLVRQMAVGYFNNSLSDDSLHNVIPAQAGIQTHRPAGFQLSLE